MMIRPQHVIEYAKVRAKKGKSDFAQLIDGLNINGRIVIGGHPENARRLSSIASGQRRLGSVVSIEEIHAGLDPNLTYTFDITSVAQFIMTAKNEAFHATIDQMINLLQQACVEDGHPVEMGLQILREKADEIGHL